MLFKPFRILVIFCFSYVMIKLTGIALCLVKKLLPEHSRIMCKSVQTM